MTSARLIGLATAVPPHALAQDEVVEVVAATFGGRGLREAAIRNLFANTGIRRRWSARPLDWFRQPRDWPERNAAYLEAADALFVEAARAALADAGLEASEIGTVVTVSSTGIATPSLEARCFSVMGFSKGVRRVPVFGLGCGGGVAGLSLAARLAQADPGRPVLLVCLELCTLAFRPDQPTKKNLVATALFGDGAAAAVLVADDAAKGPVIGPTAEHLWPDTLQIMGWDVDPEGFGVVLAVDLPPFVAARYGEAADAFFAATGVDRSGIGRFVCHPGGAKVLPALEACLSLPEGSLDIEREVLADYGNMSSPTALFVLQRALAAKVPPPLLLTALGPGFSAHFAMIGQ